MLQCCRMDLRKREIQKNYFKVTERNLLLKEWMEEKLKTVSTCEGEKMSITANQEIKYTNEKKKTTMLTVKLTQQKKKLF